MDTSLKYTHQCNKAEEITGTPSQDKLQAMIRSDSLSSLIYGFNRFWQRKIYSGYNYSENEYFDSMEQLWLAYIMYKNFNKIWNGEAWLTSNHKRNIFFYNAGKVFGILF